MFRLPTIPLPTIPTLMAFLLVTSTLAQTPPPPGQGNPGAGNTAGNAAVSEVPALIFGYVVRQGTGEPLPGAQLNLRRAEGRGQALAAVADLQGRFVIGNIPAGEYRLEVERTGYVDHEYGQVSPNRPGTVLVLAPGQQVNDLVVNMVPTGVITGRVYDANGAPLEGVDVRAMRFEYDDGVRVLENVQTAETNDLGAYRLYWLEPGEYYVSATFGSNRQQLLQLAEAIAGVSQNLQAAQAAIQAARGGAVGAGSPLDLILPQLEQAREQQAAAEIYVDTYFPGTYDAARASPVAVLPASEMGSISFTVLPTRAVTVSGRVVGPFSAADGLATSVTLVPRNTMVATTGGGQGRGRGSGGRGQDGSFSLSGVAPGSYTLVATMESRGRGGRGGGGGGNVQLSGFTNLEIGTQDLSDVVVQVQPAVTIRGQIWVDEAAAELDLDDLRVRLEPPRDIPLGSPNARIEDDGSFELEEVGQTVYRARLTGLPQDYYVVQARAGAYDALSAGIQVSSSLAPLEFWVSGGGATLEGAVDVGSNPTFVGAEVVLVPQDARRQDLYKVASADQYGRFSMRGIAPGRYSIYAWEDLPSGAYLDPLFVNQYRDRGSAVDIRQGSQAEARPRLIQAGR
jgi:hypothetical protein